MLGIIIGIASIIAIVSTIKGTSERIKEQVIGAGNNTVSINLYDGDNEYEDSYGGSKPPLLNQEQKNAVREMDHVLGATFYYSKTYTYNIYYKNRSFSGGSMYGVDEYYLDTNGYIIRAGRGFSVADYAKCHKVALIDNNAAETLFPSEDPVGKVLEIGKEPFESS